MRILYVMLFLVGLTACSSNPYVITLNDNVLYSPYGVIEDGFLYDANLQGCFNVALAQSENEEPSSITLLACSNSEVESLSGIQALSNLAQLDLGNNKITEISALYSLEKLRVLNLRNNDLRNISALFSLPILRFVDLQGNNNIACSQLDRLQEKLRNTLTRPVNCR